MYPVTRLTPRKKLSYLWGVLLIMLVMGCQPASPSLEQSVCETYCVGTDFQTFYDANGGEVVFGKPISGVINLPNQNQINTQYFESIRLDFNTATNEISIPALGIWAFEGLPDSDQIAYTSVSHLVAEPFEEYYLSVNGDEIFGEPLSPLIDDGALRVQYFENVRLEWQQGLTTVSGVYSGSIGRAHFDETANSYEIIPQPIEQQLEKVNLSAVAAEPVLYTGETQTIFVTARSLTQEPADSLVIEIEFAGNNQPVTLTGITQSDGTVRIELPSADLNLKPGERIEGVVRAFGVEGTELGQTSVSFETWW